LKPKIRTKYPRSRERGFLYGSNLMLEGNVYISREVQSVRRVYILREEDESDQALDEVLAQGLDPDWIENPTCPLCGGHTLLATEEDGEFDLLTWYCLVNEEEYAQVDAWYLVCQRIECPYEERVERTLDPTGALIFDMLPASHQVDEDLDLSRETINEQLALIAALKEAEADFPFRKNHEYRLKAEFHLRQMRKWLKKWIAQRHSGERIRLIVGGKRITGRFFSQSEKGLLCHVGRNKQLVAISLSDIDDFSLPDYEKEKRQMLKNLDLDSFVTLHRTPEYVVVQGHHLLSSQVDRFGRHTAYTFDPAAAAALGFEPHGETAWRGMIRRGQVEARYEVRTLVKIKGYWVKKIGENGKNWPDVTTEDPEAAIAIGMKLVEGPTRDEGREPDQSQVPRWSALVPLEWVEDSEEVRIYHWPIPELRA